MLRVFGATMCTQGREKMCSIITKSAYNIEIIDVVFKRHRNKHVV